MGRPSTFSRVRAQPDEVVSFTSVEPPDFDTYVNVLRERIFDYQAVHKDGTIPNFDELMSDHADVASEAWPVQAYEELLAQGHLNPNVSGMTMGPKAHGLLSADGRYYVRQQRQNG
jgi:hypothetical protein